MIRQTGRQKSGGAIFLQKKHPESTANLEKLNDYFRNCLAIGAENEGPKAGFSANPSGSPLQGSTCSIIDPGLRPLRVLALGCSVPRFQRLPQSCGDPSHSSLYLSGIMRSRIFHGEFRCPAPLTAEALKARDRTAQPGYGIADHIKPCKGGTDFSI
jgi:hypothetical protein